jgi:tRNA-splicing ligase RtcB
VHEGEPLVVVRKGATPAWPGQRGFVGGSMGDIAAVVEGTDAATAISAYHSTVHGAGRLHSRTWAKGKRNRKTGEITAPGNVSTTQMQEALRAFGGVQLRGGDVDESPFVYRKLDGVLAAQGDTIVVRHRLRPVGVVMAGANTFDPFKD